MSSAASEDLPDWRSWDAKTQKQVLEALKELQTAKWKPFYCPNRTCDGLPHGSDWDFPHARADQHPRPFTDKRMIDAWLSGRGTGKTMGGSRQANLMSERVGNIALIGATGPDLRETMIEGPSGILKQARPDQRPVWNPSRRRLEWPNGCVARGYSGEEPDRIRGDNTGWAWIDEPAHIDLIDDVWKNLLLTIRSKSKTPPRVLVTTTPKPSQWVLDLLEDPRVALRRVPTYANIHNLAEEFIENVVRPLEGTRWGRQELYGEVITDYEGTLWKTDMITYIREEDLPDLEQIAVGVDPAGSTDKRADETGLILGGRADGTYYVMADATGKYSPEKWGRRSVDLAADFKADAIVPEKNYGGEMVRSTITNSLRDDEVAPSITLVESRRGKQLRAEPIAALYERGKVLHVIASEHPDSDLGALEREMTMWVPGKGASPNRVDALVHMLTYLGKNQVGDSTVAHPTEIMKKIRERQRNRRRR